MVRNYPLASLVSTLSSEVDIEFLTRHFSNIRAANEKPMRNGEVCPKDRSEPFEKPEISDRLLELAGVKPYYSSSKA